MHILQPHNANYYHSSYATNWADYNHTTIIWIKGEVETKRQERKEKSKWAKACASGRTGKQIAQYSTEISEASWHLSVYRLLVVGSKGPTPSCPFHSIIILILCDYNCLSCISLKKKLKILVMIGNYYFLYIRIINLL